MLNCFEDTVCGQNVGTEGFVSLQLSVLQGGSETSTALCHRQPPTYKNSLKLLFGNSLA
jgi:hypothetical protein